MYIPSMFHPVVVFFLPFIYDLQCFDKCIFFLFYKNHYVALYTKGTSIYYLKTYDSLRVRKVNKILSGSKKKFSDYRIILIKIVTCLSLQIK